MSETSDIEAIKQIIGEHLVRWYNMSGKGKPPRSEWHCRCGSRFSWSHDAISHVAQALARFQWAEERDARGEQDAMSETRDE